MGFRDWMRRALGVEVKASATTQALVRNLPDAVWTPRDYQALSREGYATNPWVYACITEIARGIAGIPWRLYQGRGETARELDSHPLLDLLRREDRLATMVHKPRRLLTACTAHPGPLVPRPHRSLQRQA